MTPPSSYAIFDESIVTGLSLIGFIFKDIIEIFELLSPSLTLYAH